MAVCTHVLKTYYIVLLITVLFLLQIIKEGDESEGQRPKRSDICKISYEVKIRDTGELVEKRDQVKIYLGDNEVSFFFKM